MVGHHEGAAAVPLAGICGLSVVTGAEHVVGDESVHGALTRLQVHNGQPDLHEEAQSQAAGVSGPPAADHPYSSFLQQQGGEVRAWEADGNGVLVKNDIAAQVQQGDVTVVVIGVVVGVRPAPFHSNLLFFEFSLVLVEVSWSRDKLKC